MIVIGIDPGTDCGWAMLNAHTWGLRMGSGVWDLKPRRHEGGGMRYLRLRHYLADMLALCPPTCVAVIYEEVRRHMGTDAAHVYGGIVGVLTAVCEERSVPYSSIPVGTVKKAATGKGNASKAAMLAAAQAKWGPLVVSTDEADALWIAETWLRENCG